MLEQPSSSRAHPDLRVDSRGIERPGLSGHRLQAAYGAHLALDAVDVEMSCGTITALVGPNGSGKSTLLRCLARLHRPSGGKVALEDGRLASALSAKEFATHVALLTQSRPCPGGVTVRDVVGYGRYPHRRAWARDADPGGPDVIARAMDVAGVTAMAQRPVDSLSGGELQRVWIATCLAQDTPVLLLDEPTNHLDLRYQVEVLDLMLDLAHEFGVAVGVVLHDLDHAAAVADHVVLLSRGRVHGSGRPEDVLTGADLSQVYDIDIEVRRDGDHLAIRPLGRRLRSTVARPA